MSNGEGLNRLKTSMGSSTPVSGAGEVDCDMERSHVITKQMSHLPYQEQFHIAYSVCGILGLYPGIISDTDIQESLDQIRDPRIQEAWKQFYCQQIQNLGIMIH